MNPYEPPVPSETQQQNPRRRRETKKNAVEKFNFLVLVFVMVALHALTLLVLGSSILL